MSVILEARDLDYRIDGVQLLKRINLSLNTGEILGLVGPNGAGKTTLIRNLSGFIKPSGGAVYLKGKALHRYKDRHRARLIAYISQERRGAFPFSVLEVMTMGSFARLGYWAAPDHGEIQRARTILEEMDLKGMEHRDFSGLSGGEKQLVLFGRAKLQDSPVLLMDEPTSNLDMRHEMELLKGASQLSRQGKSIALSLHNLDRAAQFCNRIALMHRGEIFALGAPGEVLTQANLERVYKTPVAVEQRKSGEIFIYPHQQ